MPSGITHAVNELIKSGKEEGDILTLPTFKTVDIYPIFKHLFSQTAQVAMENHSNDLLYQFNRPIKGNYVLALLGRLDIKACAAYKEVSAADICVRDFDIVHFVGLRATKNRLPNAIEKVIATVNHVADKNFTKASMVQLSVMEFAQIDNCEPEFAVISYITLTVKGAEYIKQHMPDMFISEGGLPTRVE